MAGKGNPTSFLGREIRMVLVGMSAVGKSATGNTLCGTGYWAQIFHESASAMSVTNKCKQHSFKRFGYDLQLVDVPGFCHTSRSEEYIQKEIMKCVGMLSPGIHAILFIVRIGRFTEGDKRALEMFLRYFGQEAKKFVIVVFTGKDNLEVAGVTLDNYIGDCSDTLKQFLIDTSLRFIAVNNRGSNEEKENFSKDLIDKIKKMVDENGGKCYTDEMYQRCQADLREAEKNEQLEEMSQKTFEEKCKLEAAAWDEHHLQMQIDEEKLKERLKVLEVRQKEEEKKERKAELVEAQENIRIWLGRMKDFQRKQKEEFELRKEELRLEDTRKQMRETLGYMGSTRTAWQSVKNAVSSLW